MKTYVIFASLMFLSVGLLWAGCSSDDTPTDVSILSHDHRGQWRFTGQIVSDECAIGTVGQPAQTRFNIQPEPHWLLEPMTATIFPAHAILHGTATDNTLYFRTWEDVRVVEPDCTRTVRLTADLNVRAPKYGEGSLSLTWTNIVGCAGKLSPCSTVYTGTWTQLTAENIPVALPTTTPIPTATPTRKPVKPTPTQTPVIVTATPGPTATPTNTPWPTPGPTATPLSDYLTVSANPAVIADTTAPDSTSLVTACAYTQGGVLVNGVVITLSVTTGDGVLTVGSVTTAGSGCGTDTFTEQGTVGGQTQTILAQATGYAPATTTIQVTP